MDIPKDRKAVDAVEDSNANALWLAKSGEPVNASGHVQELDRQYNLVSLSGAGLVTGNVWPALGGSILVAIFNGGPPGS